MRQMRRQSRARNGILIMTHAVEKMAFINEVPWHGLGENVRKGLTAESMRKACHQDYTVSKRAVFYAGSKGNVLDPNIFALCRDNDDKLLSYVGKVYKPVQTEQVFAFFHAFVKEAQMEIETCGSLWEGKYVWVLARVKNADFAIGKKDEMRNYLLLLAPFEHGKALIMQWTNVRVVCWNTLCCALGESLRGGANAFRMPHTRDFEVEKEEAKRALGLVMKQSDEFREAAEILSKKKAVKEAVDKYFRHLLNVGEKQRTPAAIPKYQAALETSPGCDLKTAKGTWWGVLNAVTYVVDHQQGKSRDSALKNAWLGNQSILKRRALHLALEECK